MLYSCRSTFTTFDHCPSYRHSFSVQEWIASDFNVSTTLSAQSLSQDLAHSTLSCFEKLLTCCFVVLLLAYITSFGMLFIAKAPASLRVTDYGIEEADGLMLYVCQCMHMHRYARSLETQF